MSVPLLFSVIICTYQRYDLLPSAIASVLRQDIEPECFDIWVMDNSPDSAARRASKTAYHATPRLHYIELDTPGLSNARNEAAKRAQGQYLVFLDDDAEADPDWLSHYRKAWKEVGAEAGGLGGPVAPDFAVPRPSWLSDELLDYLSVYDGGPILKELPSGHGPIGANASFEREIIRLCGGFTPELGRSGESSLLSGEESELCVRIRALGKKLYYVPGPRVIHHIPKERLTRAWFRRRAAWQAISVQMKNNLTAEQALQMWPLMIDYVRKVPREHLPFMGLMWDTEDAELFRHQIACIQFYTHILISQGAYPLEMSEAVKGS